MKRLYVYDFEDMEEDYPEESCPKVPAKKWDLLRQRGFISHYGIYLGRCVIFHNTPRHGISREVIIPHEKGQKAQWARVRSALQRDIPDIEERYREVVEKWESNYSLIFRNCEHVANYIATGERKSPQLRRAGAWFTMAIAAVKLTNPRDGS